MNFLNLTPLTPPPRYWVPFFLVGGMGCVWVCVTGWGGLGSKLLCTDLDPGPEQLFLPRGRKARRSLSGRGGGAPRPPATLSWKADPADYPAGLALPYCWQRTRFRTNERHIFGWEVGPYKTIVGLFFLLARIRNSGQKSARTRDQWLSPTFVLLNSAPS